MPFQEASILINGQPLNEGQSQAVRNAITLLKDTLLETQAADELSREQVLECVKYCREVETIIDAAIICNNQVSDQATVSLRFPHIDFHFEGPHAFVFEDMLRHWYSVGDQLCSKPRGTLAVLPSGRKMVLADMNGLLTLFDASDYNPNAIEESLTLMRCLDYDFSDGCQYGDLSDDLYAWLKAPVFEESALCPKELAAHIRTCTGYTSADQWVFRP